MTNLVGPAITGGRSQLFSKTPKLKWTSKMTNEYTILLSFFALIMNPCLDFTEEVRAKRKVNNNIEIKKSKTQKTMN